MLWLQLKLRFRFCKEGSRERRHEINLFNSKRETANWTSEAEWRMWMIVILIAWNWKIGHIKMPSSRCLCFIENTDTYTVSQLCFSNSCCCKVTPISSIIKCVVQKKNYEKKVLQFNFKTLRGLALWFIRAELIMYPCMKAFSLLLQPDEKHKEREYSQSGLRDKRTIKTIGYSFAFPSWGFPLIKTEDMSTSSHCPESKEKDTSTGDVIWSYCLQDREEW